MTAFGATSSPEQVPANVRNPPFSVTQFRIRNGSSCLYAAVQPSVEDRLSRVKAVIRSFAHWSAEVCQKLTPRTRNLRTACAHPLIIDRSRSSNSQVSPGIAEARPLL